MNDSIEAAKQQWRGVKIEKFSAVTEWRSLSEDGRRFVKENGDASAAKLRDTGLIVWRAKVGNGAKWIYAGSIESAIDLAIAEAATSET